MYRIYQLIYRKIQENLKSYIKGGEIDEKSSFQNLQITLTNVRIKKSALNNLMIPFAVHNTSKVKSIKLSISHAPKLKLVVDGLHLVLNPSSLKHLNSDFLREAKMSKLEKWEKNQRDSMNAAGTFGKKLLDWMLPNLLTRVKVELKNFTIIYQDTQNLQILPFPSLAIIKLESLKIFRAEPDSVKKENLTELISQSIDKAEFTIQVNIVMQNFSIILSCDPVIYEKGTKIDNIYDEMKISERNYLLSPISLAGCLQIGKELKTKTLYFLSINLPSIQLGLNEFQLMFIEGFINFIDRSSQSNRYSMFKPKSSIKSSPGEWWKFIIQSFKHDLRFNMNNVIKMQNTKIKYIELYKRVQTIIKAPVLLKLTPAEEMEMKNIEESLLYEEIIEFRTQALEQIKKKVNTDKGSSNKKHDEKTKKYFHEYYNEIKDEIDFESADEASEEIECFSQKGKILVDFSINRVIFSLNLLKNHSIPKIKLLDTAGCKCIRCVPSNRESELKSSRNFPFMSKKTLEVPEREFIQKQKKVLKTQTEYSLLPNRKIRDIILEYGEEIFKVGSICSANRNGEPCEPNLMKEITLMLVVIDNISVGVSGNQDFIIFDLAVKNHLAFDPLLCTCSSLNSGCNEKIKSINDLLEPKPWFDFIFHTGEDKKVIWSLRHFLKSQNCLNEFEFWLHHIELLTGKDLCLCGSYYKSEQNLRDTFIKNDLNPQNIIHVPESKREELLKNGNYKFLENLVQRIEQNLVKSFNYFIQTSIRYFISSILPSSSDHNSINLVVKLAQDSTKGSVLEKYAILVEANIENLNLQISTSSLSYLKLLVKPDKAGMQTKSIFKKNFIETLEDLPGRMRMIRGLLVNVDHEKRTLDALAVAKFNKIPKFTLDLTVKSVDLTLASMASADNLKLPARMFVRLKELKIEKDVNRESGLELDQKEVENYLSFKANMQSFEVFIQGQIVFVKDLQVVGNFNPFLLHPTLCNLLLDLHVGSVCLNIDKNLVILVHILNSLDHQISKNEQEAFSENWKKDIRSSELDHLSELKHAIDNFKWIDSNPRKKTKSDMNRRTKEEFYRRNKRNLIDDNLKQHSSPDTNCKHCIVRNVKMILVLHVSVGSNNKSYGKGLTVKLFDDNSEFFEVTCQHLFVKVEESPMSAKVAVISSKFVGKNKSKDLIVLKPGFENQKIQPLVLGSLARFFPLTMMYFMNDADSFGYLLASITKDFYKNPEFMNESCFDFKRSVSNAAKIKLPEMDINEHEHKINIYLNLLFMTLDLKKHSNSQLLLGILHIIKWAQLGQSLLPKQNFKVFTLKSLATSLSLKLNAIKLTLNLKNLEIDSVASDIEVSINPVSITPALNQLLFKNKDTEAILSYHAHIRIASFSLELHEIVSIYIRNLEVFKTELRESKCKIINKVFTCSTDRINEKVELRINSCQVFSGSTLIVTVPGEFFKDDLVVAKGKHIEVIVDRTDILHVNVPQVGVFLQFEVLKDILKTLIGIKTPNLKVPGIEHYFVHDLNLLHKKEKRSRVFVLVNDLYAVLECRGYQIFMVKVHLISLFHNVPKDQFEKNNFNNFKELGDDSKYLHSNEDELVIVFKNLELVPNSSIHKNMIETSKDYSVSIKINTKLKTININSTHSVKAIIINKVFEELILSIKDLKSVKPKKSEPDKDNFSLYISINHGEIIIPRSSKSEDFSRITFASGSIHVYNADSLLQKPSAISESTQVFNEKEVMHEDLLPAVPVFCDLVDINLSRVKIETYLSKSHKELGCVEHIKVFVRSPSMSEDFECFLWKTDSVVDVDFREANLNASLVRFI